LVDTITLIMVAIAVLAVAWLLATEWVPLGVSVSYFVNFIFILLVIGLVLGLFSLFIKAYPRILGWCLANKGTFLLIPAIIMLLGLNIWIGFNRCVWLGGNGLR
jgi:copper/silver efflux system protein